MFDLKKCLGAVWLLILVGCTGNGSGPVPSTELQDESAVSNGGNLLTAVIHKFLTKDMPEMLQKPENEGLLADGERGVLIGFLAKKGIPLVPVFPMDVINKDSVDRFGKKTLIRDGHLVNEKGELCTERIVFENQTKRWVLEIDEPTWDQMTSFGKEFPINKSKSLLKLAFQYAHIKKILGRTGDGLEDLVLPATAIKGENEDESSQHEVRIVAGTAFIGEIYCPSIRFDYEALPKPASEKRWHRCAAKIDFKLDGKANVMVTEKIGGAVYTEYKDLAYTQDEKNITFKSGSLTRTVSMLGWGNDDVLQLSAEDRIYRVNDAMASVEGKSYLGDMFCDLAENGGLLKAAPWEPRAVFPVKSKDICRVLVIFKKKEAESNVRYFSVEVMKKSGEKVYNGTGWYEQIGVNVLLHHDGSPRQEGYLWLCRECQNHMAIGAGEFLFDTTGDPAEELPDKMWGNFTAKDVRLGDLFPDTHGSYDTRVQAVFKFERLDKPDDEGYVGRVRLIRTDSGPFGISTAYIGRFREAGLTVIVDFLSFDKPMILKNAGDRIVTSHYTALADECEECEE